MIAARTQIEPCNAVADVGVRARTRGHVRRALWYLGIGRPWDCSVQGGSATVASLRVLAHQGRGRIGVHAERSVVGLAAYIRHLKHEVFRDPPFHRKVPLLDSGCE